jgi:hypothetical protein
MVFFFDIVEMMKSRSVGLVGKVECTEKANMRTKLLLENPVSPQGTWIRAGMKVSMRLNQLKLVTLVSEGMNPQVLNIKKLLTG